MEAEGRQAILNSKEGRILWLRVLLFLPGSGDRCSRCDGMMAFILRYSLFLLSTVGEARGTTEGDASRVVSLIIDAGAARVVVVCYSLLLVGGIDRIALHHLSIVGGYTVGCIYFRY